MTFFTLHACASTLLSSVCQTVILFATDEFDEDLKDLGMDYILTQLLPDSDNSTVLQSLESLQQELKLSGHLDSMKESLLSGNMESLAIVTSKAVAAGAVGVIIPSSLQPFIDLLCGKVSISVQLIQVLILESLHVAGVDITGVTDAFSASFQALPVESAESSWKSTVWEKVEGGVKEQWKNIENPSIDVDVKEIRDEITETASESKNDLEEFWEDTKDTLSRIPGIGSSTSTCNLFVCILLLINNF